MPRQGRLNASVALVNRMARLEEMTELDAWEKLSVFAPTSPLRMNGGRELRRTVEKLIQIPLSNLILSGELSKHPSWQVVCSDKRLSVVPI